MKPLTDTLWTIVRWTLPLTVAAVIVAVALGSHRVGEEVRRRVREMSGIELEWEIQRVGNA